MPMTGWVADPTAEQVVAVPATLLLSSGPSTVSETSTASPPREVLLPWVVSTPVPREDWERAAQLARAAPSWRQFIASRREAIDSWRKTGGDRAELVAGFMHHHVDPLTGAARAWTPTTPEPPAQGSSAQLRLHEAWAFYVRSHHIRCVHESARLYRATGRIDDLEWAAAQLDFYAAQYTRWPLHTSHGRSRMFRQALDEATASFGLVDAIRLLTPFVTAQRAATWRQQLLAPMAANLQHTHSPLTNIGLWQAAAVLRIGLHLGDPALVSWGLHSPTGTRATLAHALGAEGLWNEGSFGYHGFVIDALHHLVLGASLEGHAELVETERDALRRLLLSTLDYRFDDGSLPRPGDSTSALVAIDARQHAAVYRVLPTPWGLRRASASATWDSLVDPPAQPGSEPALPPVRTRHAPAARMALLRQGTWQAFIHYGQAVANHAQEEALHVELHDGLQPISTDSGTVFYGSPLHQNYFSRGASHNVPLIDGLGQQGWAPGQVERWNREAALISVRHPSYRPGVAAWREWQLTEQGLSERTRIAATDGKTRRLGAAFHTTCQIKPDQGLVQASAMTAPPQTAATAHWQGLQAYRAQSQWSVRLQCGPRTYRYAVNGPPGQTVFLGMAPTTPLPALRPVVYYEATSEAVVFEATIARVP